MKNFKKVKIIDIVEFQRGKDLTRDNMKDGKYPVVGSNGIIGYHDLYTTNKPSITIGRSGNIGRPFIYDGPTWAHNTTLYIKKFKNIDPYYIYYLLKNLKLEEYGSGSTVPTLNRNDIHEKEVIIPIDLDFQKSVSKFLKSIDKKIELNNKINDNLEKQMKLLYDYWFVQFEFPDENGKPYRLSGGKINFHNNLKYNIPEKFDALPLSNLVLFLSGYPFSSNDYDDNGKYKLITIKNVQDTGINLEVDNYIKTIPERMQDYCKLKQHDILMSLTGNVGRIGLMYSNNCLLNQRVALTKPINANLNGYIYCLLKSSIIKNKLEYISNGSSQSNLSPVEAGKIVISYNYDVALKFCEIVNPAMDKIVKNLSENQNLTTLRDFLLPLLMNGQATIE